MEFDSLSLEVPEGWTHRHLLSFRIDRGTPQDRDPSIVVARLARIETLETSVLHHLTHLAQRLPDFLLVRRANGAVDGRRAIRAHFRAVRAGMVREEISVYVEAPEGDLLVLSCSWVQGDTRAEAVLQAFERMLAAARIAAGERRSPIPPPPEPVLELPEIPMPSSPLRAPRFAP